MAYSQTVNPNGLYFPSLSSQFADLRSASKAHKRSRRKCYPWPKYKSPCNSYKCKLCSPPKNTASTFRMSEARVYAKAFESRYEDEDVDTVYWEMGFGDPTPSEPVWWQFEKGPRRLMIGQFEIGGEEVEKDRDWVNDWMWDVQRVNEEDESSRASSDDEWSVVSGDEGYEFL